MRHNRACFAHLRGWKSSCKERKQASKQEKKYLPKQNTKHSPLDNYWSSSYGSLPLSLPPKKFEFFLEKDLHSIQSMRSRIRALPLTKILNLERSFPSSFFPPPWPPLVESLLLLRRRLWSSSHRTTAPLTQDYL